MKTKSYDAIIIGSGLGGLTTAALLSKKFNKRVLVLEQHFKIGGLTHEFKRVVEGTEYKWDVGLHYVGQLMNGTLTRQLFDYITDGNLKWRKMTDEFEHFIYPDFSITEASDPLRYKNDLVEMFPTEKVAINKYFKDIKRASSWYVRDFFTKFFPKWMSIWVEMGNALFRKVALSTTKKYLNNNFKNEKLKALLVSQWGDYGLPPNESSFAIHALVAQNYMDGAYFPIGGSDKISQSIIPVIEKSGGKCLINHSVSEIIINKGKANGVKVRIKKGDKVIEEDFHSDTIISNVGAFNTFTKLLPKDIKHSKNEEIIDFPKGYSACTLYIGLKENPEKLGIKGENYWIYDSYDHKEMIEDVESIRNGNMRYAYLSFPSIKNPEARGYTAEILSILPYEIFEEWKDQKWMNRAEEYKELKNRITKGYIDLIERHIKGFKNLVIYSELSTPLTMEHFTKRQKGEMYGIPAIPQRHKVDWLKPKTEIQNLYLTGSDVCSLGIQGALFGGLATASVLGGQLGFFKLMGDIKKN